MHTTAGSLTASGSTINISHKRNDFNRKMPKSYWRTDEVFRYNTEPASTYFPDNSLLLFFKAV